MGKKMTCTFWFAACCLVGLQLTPGCRKRCIARMLPLRSSRPDITQSNRRWGWKMPKSKWLRPLESPGYVPHKMLRMRRLTRQPRLPGPKPLQRLTRQLGARHEQMSNLVHPMAHDFEREPATIFHLVHHDHSEGFKVSWKSKEKPWIAYGAKTHYVIAWEFNLQVLRPIEAVTCDKCSLMLSTWNSFAFWYIGMSASKVRTPSAKQCWIACWA